LTEKVFNKFKERLEQFEFFGKLDIKNNIEDIILSQMLLLIDGEGNIVKFPREGGFLDQPADWMEIMYLVINTIRKINNKKIKSLK